MQTGKSNNSHAKAANAYNAKNYSAFTVRIKHDGSDGFTLDDLRQAAQRDGVSFTSWIVGLIRDNI